MSENVKVIVPVSPMCDTKLRMVLNDGILSVDAAFILNIPLSWLIVPDMFPYEKCLHPHFFGVPEKSHVNFSSILFICNFVLCNPFSSYVPPESSILSAITLFNSNLLFSPAAIIINLENSFCLNLIFPDKSKFIFVLFIIL